MGNKLVKYLLDRPKTYVPLVVLVIIQIIQPMGVEINPELEQSLNTVCLALAGILLRRNMIKEKNVKDMEDRIRKELISEMGSNSTE